MGSVNPPQGMGCRCCARTRPNSPAWPWPTWQCLLGCHWQRLPVRHVGASYSMSHTILLRPQPLVLRAPCLPACLQYGVPPGYSLDTCDKATLGGFGICASYAIDPQDGDLSANVTVTDVTPCPPRVPLCMRCAPAAATAGLCLPGKYLLRYSVSDTDGNVAQVRVLWAGLGHDRAVPGRCKYNGICRQNIVFHIHALAGF